MNCGAFLQFHANHWATGHKRDQILEEWLSFVLSIEGFGVSAGELGHFQSANYKFLSFDRLKYRSDVTGSHNIGFNHSKSSLGLLFKSRSGKLINIINHFELTVVYHNDSPLVEAV